MALTPRAPASLGRRLVLGTLAFGVAFALVTVAIRSWSAWERQRDSMLAELTLIDQVFQGTLTRAIWEMDRDALQQQLRSAAAIASVGRIVVRIRQANGGEEVLEHRQSGWMPSPRLPSLRRTLTHAPFAGAGEVLGELTLDSDERVLWQRLLGELGGIVVAQLIQSVLLAGLVMWLFNRSVTVHVRDIARHLGALSPLTLERPLRLARTTAREDELSLLESGVNQLQASLSDYLERQRRDERELAAHRDRLAELVQERTIELQSANTRLQELLLRDPLTDLANRRHFDDRKEVEFRRARRQGLPLAVLLCDVDYFKRYNDTYGHGQGDQCLRAVAQALRGSFARAGELAARIGGEEFAVLLPGVDHAGALAAAERARAAVAALAIPHAGSEVAPHVTLSIGVAALDHSDPSHFDVMLHHADQALYRAKSAGRDRVAA